MAISYTYTINTSGITNGTPLYWGLSGTDLTDFVATSGSVTSNGNATDFVIQVNESPGVDGDRPFTISVAQNNNPVGAPEQTLAATLKDPVGAVFSYTFWGINTQSWSSPNQTANHSLVFNADGTLSISCTGGGTLASFQPNYNQAGVFPNSHFNNRWMSTGGNSDDYQIQVTATYSSTGTGDAGPVSGLSVWATFPHTVTSTFFSAVGTANQGQAIYTINIKKYSGTLGTGDTVMTSRCTFLVSTDGN